MVASVWGMCVEGLQARFVRVEVDIANGLPAFDIVGLPTTAVREARERVRAAIRNSGFSFPMQRITVNLAPADLRKEGSGLDLAIAAGILAALGQVPPDLDDYVLSGELSLNGCVRPVTGVLTLALALQGEHAMKALIVAQENLREAQLVERVASHGVRTLTDLTDLLCGGKGNPQDKPAISSAKAGEGTTKGAEGWDDAKETATETRAAKETEARRVQVDFSDVRGHLQVKRALEVAAAGAHNILMIGPPGAGKTLMARAFAGILPAMSREECLQVTQIYSLAGLLPQGQGEPLIRQRPFRSPHHTTTLSAMMGGGQKIMPGEVALADHGVLFLDEMPEFSREVLEALRQPLEDGVVHIARQRWKAIFPARLSLIATMNPCPCGFLGDSGRECRCTPTQIRNYRNRISGPLLDRFDIQIEVSRLHYDDLHGPGEGESTEKIAERVAAARFLQQERLRERLKKESGHKTELTAKSWTNARMNGVMTREICCLDKQSQLLLKRVFTENKMSGRAYDRVLRVARSIADLAQEDIRMEHIAESLSYRALDVQGLL